MIKMLQQRDDLPTVQGIKCIMPFMDHGGDDRGKSGSHKEHMGLTTWADAHWKD